MPEETVFVTGATGLVGRALVQRLIDKRPVRALVRDESGALDLKTLGVDVVVGDLCDDPGDWLADCQAVVHCAASVGADGDLSEMRQVNVGGTQRVLAAAEHAQVRRLVHLSTCAVYGSPNQTGVTEAWPLTLRGEPYADTKIEAEHSVWEAASRGLKVVIARPSQIYGPGSEEFILRPLRMLKAGRLVLVGGGKGLCKPVFLDDVVDGIILCLDTPDIDGEAFNLANGVLSWETYLESVAALSGVKRLRSIPFPLAWMLAFIEEQRVRLQGGKPGLTRGALKVLISQSGFSNDKARTRLGWVPQHDLKAGLEKTRDWLQYQRHRG